MAGNDAKNSEKPDDQGNKEQQQHDRRGVKDLLKSGHTEKAGCDDYKHCQEKETGNDQAG